MYFKLFSDDDDPFSITLPPPFTRNDTENGTTESSHKVPVKKNEKNARKTVEKQSGVEYLMI